MKILQVTAPREFVIHELPTPRPGPVEVLMRINAVTTCPQWDLHLRHNEPMFIGHQFHYPYTLGQPGHEATGVIEEVGIDVDGLAPGDRVSAWRDPGHDAPGCYAQYVVLRAVNVIRVPETVPAEALAPVELAMCMATVFRMLKEMDAIRGRSIGVAGLGPAGLVAIQMAKAEGAAKVIGFDLLPDRRELASRIGATTCYATRGVNHSARVGQGQRGCDCSQLLTALGRSLPWSFSWTGRRTCWHSSGCSARTMFTARATTACDCADTRAIHGSPLSMLSISSARENWIWHLW